MKKQALQLATVIWKGLRRIVERIGKWAIRALVNRGAYSLENYLMGRVDAFRVRLKRVLKRKRHAKWRPDFIRGRIRRYQAAARWLNRKYGTIYHLTDKHVAPYIRDLPEDSPWENPRAWRRMVNA